MKHSYTGVNSRHNNTVALAVKNFLCALDPRFLVFACSCAGICAWLLPWQTLALFFAMALLLVYTTCTLAPQLRRFIVTYAAFACFWGLGFFAVKLWGGADSVFAVFIAAVIFAVRLYCILGLALAVPLSITPLVTGRVFTWYVQQVGRLELFILCLPPLRGVRPRITQNAWRCGLALAIMVAFLPRSFRALYALRQNLQIRAPHLPLRRRLFFIALAALRLLSAQTWDMTLAIASRDLYKPLPWQWR